MQAPDFTRALKRVEAEIEQTKVHLLDLEAVRVSLIAMRAGNGHADGNGASAKGRPKRAKTDTGVEKTAHSSLPAISGSFWLEQLGRGQSTTVEIVARAMEKLNLPPTSRKALYVRAANWLNFAKNRATPLVAVVEKRDGVNVYKKA